MSHVDELQLVAAPAVGRVFRDRRRVRLGDASPKGRLRLDAIARYLQDIANDDARDALTDGADGWVVRRTVIEVRKPAVYREEVHLTTFCSGTGSRWAERRTSIVGSSGASIECAALWVHVDLQTLRPAVLGEDFHRVFGPSAEGRIVRSRLNHNDPEPGFDGGVWPVRFCDFDVVGHLNNASYWVAVEEELSRRTDLRWPLRAEVEHRTGLEARHAARLIVIDEPDSLNLWLVGEPGLFASAIVRPLP